MAGEGCSGSQQNPFLVVVLFLRSVRYAQMHGVGVGVAAVRVARQMKCGCTN